MSAPVKLHHQMTIVKDMDAAIHMYRDVFGMTLVSRVIVPDTETKGMEEVGSKETWGEEVNFQWEIACLDSGAGALIELCHPTIPPVQVSKPMWKDYLYTGHTEQGFMVDDIDEWYKKIVAAGYRPQSEPWMAGNELKSFAFYDYEDNVIQLTQDLVKRDVPAWERMFGTEHPDQRSEAARKMCEESYKMPEKMRILGFDHMHVKVPDYAKFNEKFAKFMGLDWFMEMDMTEQHGTEVAYEPWPVGMELFNPTDVSKSKSAKIASESNGIFCVCYKVEKLETAIKEMAELGYEMLEYYDNAPILEALFDTKEDFGFYIELTEYPFESLRGMQGM